MRSNWENKLEYFKTILVEALEVPKVELDWLKKACAQAKKDGAKANTYLVGHIKEEYHFKKVEPHFVDFILSCLELPIAKQHSDSLSYLSDNKPFYLHDMWVNYMKKHEFNPPHGHSGIYSFVIFVKIPYDLKKEEKHFAQVKIKNSTHAYSHTDNHTSKFMFLNTFHDGRIITKVLDVDKSFEGKMLLFPSGQLHQVFPFYTSNDYRITVSGNIRIKV
jgi:hypothetical protein